ncbi:MAG: SLC13 family permease [Rhodobiaceae bacterium]|nr:SLC13 family permease [Rhodobiaceae bacterium]
MTADQIVLSVILVGVLGLLLWGRIRYDLIAFAALIIAVVSGVVKTEDAFSGFGHPATVIIAIVLIISRGLLLSGAVDLISRYVVDAGRGLGRHIAFLSTIAAGLSAVMNNVAALAILMPVEMQASAKAGRSPSMTLMPLSFATILGGLITLIGTPPNIIIAQFRETALGTPFRMFDFAPVGLACAVAGVAFISFVGWRLLPADLAKRSGARELFELEGYIAELLVAEDSTAIDRLVRDLDPEADEHDVKVLGLVRNGRRLPGGARRETVREGDILVLEGAPDGLDAIATALKLSFAQKGSKIEDGSDMALVEAVVPGDAVIEGRTMDEFRLRARFGCLLLGIARQGTRVRSRLRRLPIRAGDVLLLYGQKDRLDEAVARLGALPLADRGLKVTTAGKAGLAVLFFAAAILLATFGVLYLPVALAAAAVLMILFRIVPARDVYMSIEWPVIVLLGSLIPIGAAFEDAGGTSLIAHGIIGLTAGLPGWVVMTVLLVITMTLSDVLNNTATTIIAAPVAIDLARGLEANPDPFLMAVAIGASCAFLTPIGHKNNTLVMGPGGYGFGDYWRMGLPLEVIVVAVAVPAILLVWPL